MIHRELRGTVAVLRMEHGKVNALDSELFGELIETLKAEVESPSRAVVLTGSGKAFSAGVDLFRLLNGGTAYVNEFVPLLNQGLEALFLFPKPMVAAINGHAIAGGCILGCCGDHRIMAAGEGMIGVPELQVGVPFPSVALEIVRFGCSPQYLQEVVYGARTYAPEDAKLRGLIDEIAEPGSLLQRACDHAAKLGAIPAQSFRLAKQMLRKPVTDRYQANASMDVEVLGAWRNQEIHDVIRGYLQQTIGKR